MLPSYRRCLKTNFLALFQRLTIGTQPFHNSHVEVLRIHLKKSSSNLAVMATFRILGAVLLFVGLAEAWEMTSYYNYSTEVFGGTVTLSALIDVVPTGPVTGTSSDVKTTTFLDPDYGFTYIYTLTSLFLEPTGSWCASQNRGYGNTKICTGTIGLLAPPIPTLNPLLKTRYFAPILITQPSSCAKTSFSYTSSIQIYPTELPGSMATEATIGGEAVFITTHIAVASTNLGGQIITATAIDVFLKSGALQGVTAVSQASYLSQCVDPSSFMCSFTLTPSPLFFGCGPTPIVYPPQADVTGSSIGTGTGGRAGPTATTSTKSGANALYRCGNLGICLVGALVSLISL
jgi:hypothetical protein